MNLQKGQFFKYFISKSAVLMSHCIKAAESYFIFAWKPEKYIAALKKYRFQLFKIPLAAILLLHI